MLCLNRGLVGLWLAAALAVSGVRSSAAVLDLFSTGFEVEEGYDPGFDLEGQQGWISSALHPGDTGILTNIFEGGGQQAYLGFSGPTDSPNVYLWRPIEPAPLEYPVVEFSVTLDIVDSTNPDRRDFFEWSPYNIDGVPLFTFGFDNDSLEIYYALENGTNFWWTGVLFEPEVQQRVVIRMDLDQNLWTAEVNDVLLVEDEVITEFDSNLDIGDVTAAWIYRDPENPGDNFMTFDDYSLRAIAPTVPYLTNMSRLPDGSFRLRVVGDPNVDYAVLVSEDLEEWSSLGTNSSSSGVFDFIDDTAVEFPRSFYRAVLIP